MDLATINNLLNKTFNDLNLEFIGIFIKGKVLTSRHIHKSERLEDYFSRLVEKSLEINEAIKNFNAEFLLSEGKDYAIMVYYLSPDIAIGIIKLGKPNFSLLKVGTQDLAKDLKKYEKDFLEYYEKYLKPKEEEKKQYEEKPIKEYKENLKEKTNVKDIQEENNQKEDITYSEDIIELEKVLSSTQETTLKEETKVVDNKVPTLEDILNVKEEIFQDNTSQNDIPSLEEILLQNPEIQEELKETKESLSEITHKEAINNINEILDDIEKEFIKVIGPFGKFIMKRKKEDFFKTGNVTKYSVLKFIHSLAEEIPEAKKRETFIENTKVILLNL